MENLFSFSHKSWHSRYIGWVWGVNCQDKYKTMCPYFWVFVVTTIFIVPILIAKAAIRLLPILNRVPYVVYLCMISFLLGFLTRYIPAFDWGTFLDLLGALLIIISVLTVFWSAMYGASLLIEKFAPPLAGTRLVKMATKGTKIVGAMTVAAYKRYCPLITWK